jgi:hypothetical protein
MDWHHVNILPIIYMKYDTTGVSPTVFVSKKKNGAIHGTWEF